jgi:hypothetical protein
MSRHGWPPGEDDPPILAPRAERSRLFHWLDPIPDLDHVSGRMETTATSSATDVCRFGVCAQGPTSTSTPMPCNSGRRPARVAGPVEPPSDAPAVPCAIDIAAIRGTRDSEAVRSLPLPVQVGGRQDALVHAATPAIAAALDASHRVPPPLMPWETVLPLTYALIQPKALRRLSCPQRSLPTRLRHRRAGAGNEAGGWGGVLQSARRPRPRASDVHPGPRDPRSMDYAGDCGRTGPMEMMVTTCVIALADPAVTNEYSSHLAGGGRRGPGPVRTGGAG